MIIFDTEIQNLIPPKDGKRLLEFTYCKGWKDFVGMGLACLVMYDSARKEYRIFDEFMIDELKSRFKRTDLVVGFNNINFDNELLAAYDIKIPSIKCYDLLVEIARAAGTPNDYSGLGLNAICQANFNTSKTGDGSEAPKLYQTGNFGQLFDYCLADVRLTKAVYDRIHDTGHIINPRDNKWIKVNRPR